MLRGKILLRGFHIAAGQFIFIGKGNAMDHKIQLAPLRLNLREHGINRCSVRDIAMADDNAAQGVRQRPHPLFQRLALIGESEFRALIGSSLGNAPGNRTVVGNAHHQAALALQNSTSHARKSIPSPERAPSGLYPMPAHWKSPWTGKHTARRENEARRSAGFPVMTAHRRPAPLAILATPLFGDPLAFARTWLTIR